MLFILALDMDKPQQHKARLCLTEQTQLVEMQNRGGARGVLTFIS